MAPLPHPSMIETLTGIPVAALCVMDGFDNVSMLVFVEPGEEAGSRILKQRS